MCLESLDPLNKALLEEFATSSKGIATRRLFIGFSFVLYIQASLVPGLEQSSARGELYGIILALEKFFASHIYTD